MKKMLDTKFLFILGLSILVLIGLGIGAFYLFDDSDNTFIKSGYVINPLSSKVEKYYFAEETSYRENLSSMIEFKDIDNNNVTILKDSFLHYNDGGMSFLKRGAILDLNSINGKDPVAFYNITSESIIEKTSDNYIIKTSTSDIKLKNFIGRINDDKYIIVGNLELKIPGNNATVKGDYFEVVYSENGIVDIENRETKYQVTAEGTYIFANDILIDLGNKKISKKNEDIMSITAITIDGDENIEIIPKAKTEPTTKNNNNGEGSEGNGNEGNNGGTQNGGTSVINKENALAVNISDAKVTSTDITLKFDIENSVATDNFSLRVTNLEDGTIVRRYDSIQAGRPYTVSFLNPNTKYLFTVVNETDNSKYVQKMYETSPLGISIEKAYATENKLGYTITVDNNSEVTYAKMILKKFDEETGKTETVKDSEGNDRVIELRNIETGKSYEKFFGDLESDSIYTAVLTDFKVPPYNLGSDDESNSYQLAVTAMTLKKLPDFGNVNLTKDKTESKFKFAISDIEDEDNAIVSYTYLIYNYEEVEPSEDDPTEVGRRLVQAWPAIVKNNASPIEIPVGEGPDKLKADPRYYYKIVIEYFDNEKILEYIITDNDGFEMEKEPLVKIEPNREDTSYNRIVGTIYLTDNSCLLSNNDEGECSLTRNATVQIIDDPDGTDDLANNNDNNAVIVATRNIVFTPVDGRLQATIDIGNLEENKFYTIRVKANRTDMPNSGAVKIAYADAVKGIQTKSLSTFYIEWHDEEGDHQDVVNLTSQFIADNTGILEREESALAIKRVEISLYEGELSTELIENDDISPLVNPEVKLYVNNFDIKREFYDNSYQIGSDRTFNLNYDTLASKSTNGKIQKYYTVYIKAYYDEAGTKPITLSNKSHVYRVDDALLREDLGEMTIKAVPIRQGNDGPYTNLNVEETIIGYDILATWQVDKLLAASFEPKKVRIFVVDKNNPNATIKFYVDGENEPRTEISRDIGITTLASARIYMDYGSETKDNIMRRGNDYYVGFEIEAMSTSDNDGRISYLPINDDGIPRSHGKYVLVSEPKEIPELKMYPLRTTASNATYAYEIDDPDNALYRENTESNYNLYYDIENVEKVINISADKKNNVSYNYFKGEVTIPNLNKGDYYAIYLKLKDKDDNVLKYPDVSESTQRLFEGEYKSVDYNFNFDIINNELTDNRVKIKILGDDELLERVVNYKATFTTRNTNGEIDKTIDFSFGKLSSCGGENGTINCLIVDYDALRQAGMKSTNTRKEIEVKVEVMYDNGFTGYGYAIGNSNESDYKYIIMQDNNTKAAPGEYIILTSRYNPVFWDPENYNHKGYYRYTFGNNNDLESDELKYTSIFAKTISASNVNTSGYFPRIKPSTTGMGKMTTIQNNNNVALNPKMLAIDEKSYDDDRNKFSFSSYTPTIKITDEYPMINGEELSIELFGADLNEFCEESNGTSCVNNGTNGTYNLYIDIWDNVDDIGDKDKIVMPTTTIRIVDGVNKYTKRIEGLEYNTQYYFRVYTWLKKNNVKNYTQLFDDDLSANNEFTTKDYTFTTKGNELFQGVTIKSIMSTASSAAYGARMLNTELKLQAYSSPNVKFNYDLTYVVCKDTATEEECNPSRDYSGNEEADPRLLTNTIAASRLSSIYNDSLAIDRDFEHGKDYKIFVYATYEHYDNYAENKIATTVPKRVYLGTRKPSLSRLITPSFQNVARKAIIDENGQYAIEITPDVKDESKVLLGGNYYIKLLSGSSAVGTMKVMEGNSYVSVGSGEEYLDYAFSIEDINNQMHPVRITGLNPDTVYSIVIFGTANVNNYDADVPIAERTKVYQTDPPITIYSTNENGVAFGNIEFTATQNSIIVTFLGGSNISNIVRVEYTIGNWSNFNNETKEFYDETLTYHGEYLVSENGFTSNENNDPQYIISPEGMTNVKGNGYPSIIKFYLLGEEEPIKYIGSPVYE